MRSRSGHEGIIGRRVDIISRARRDFPAVPAAGRPRPIPRCGIESGSGTPQGPLWMNRVGSGRILRTTFSNPLWGATVANLEIDIQTGDDDLRGGSWATLRVFLAGKPSEV